VGTAFHRELIASVAAVVLVIGTVAYHTSGRKEHRVEALDPDKIIVVRTPGGMLEVAKLQHVEELSWQAKYECPLIDCSAVLEPTISRVRVSVHYVYRIPLVESWELKLNGDHYELTVPGLQPQSPVAFDTTKMEIESKRGWFSPSQRGNEQSLMRQLGPELDHRAGQDAYLGSVQAEASKTVTEFADKWMKDQGKQLQFPVKVIFKDETKAGAP
jgi:hypothetical protein